MNINKYSILKVLTFTLISSVIFGVVNSTSEVLSQSSTSNDNNTTHDTSTSNSSASPNPNNLNSSKSINSHSEQENNSTNNQDREKLQPSNNKSQQSTSNSDTQSPKQSSQRDVKKIIGDEQSLTIKDFIILGVIIDLPILIILLVFAYLNKKQQQKQLKKIKELEIISNQITSQTNTIKSILSEIYKLQKSNQEIGSSQAMLFEAFNQLQSNQPVSQESHIHSHLNYDSLSEPLNRYQSNHQPNNSDFNSVAVVDKISQFVDNYNQNKNLSSEQIIATVTSTQENVEQRRSGHSDTITLGKTNKKKYWIIELDSNYYLIPHADIKIDEYNIKTLESLFDCINFTAEYSSFNLIQPAKVSEVSSESWQLEEKGKLEFF